MTGTKKAAPRKAATATNDQAEDSQEQPRSQRIRSFIDEIKADQEEYTTQHAAQALDLLETVFMFMERDEADRAKRG